MKRRKKGRGDGGGQYMPLSYPMAQSVAWRSLSGAALKVFIELRCRYNGANNGALTLSMDEAARLLGMSKGTAQRAFRELQEKGFVKMIRRGQWYGRIATTWATTDVSLDGIPPTRDWRSWQPPKTGSRYSHDTVLPRDGFISVPND